MPADLSRSRLGWRVLDLLNDTANWGAKKYILGEVFEVDNTTATPTPTSTTCGSTTFPATGTAGRRC